jgi:hypothetical protein
MPSTEQSVLEAQICVHTPHSQLPAPQSTSLSQLMSQCVSLSIGAGDSARPQPLVPSKAPTLAAMSSLRNVDRDPIMEYGFFI